jgi:hypothetical protein
VSEAGFISGTFPQPSSAAAQCERASWKRQMGRDYANPQLPDRILEKRYGMTVGQLTPIALEFPGIASRLTARKGGRRQ